MKTKTLLLASLFVAALTAQAQTVEYTTEAGKETINAGDLTDGQLKTISAITLKGAWGSADVAKLNAALMDAEDQENDRLNTATFGESAVITSMEGCFQDCKRLETVTMPTVANNHPVSFCNAFRTCKALKTVDLSSFTNIQTMERAFEYCQNLQTVTMPTKAGNADVDFSSAFSNCYKLSTIDLSAFTRISSLKGTFSNCAMTSVKLPSTYEGVGGINLDMTFEGCPNLTSVDLRAFTSVGTYYATFRYCTKMEEIYLGTVEVTTSDTSDGYEGTFTGCPSTCKVYLPKGVMEAPENWRVNAPVIFIPDGGSAGIEANDATEVIPATTHVYSIDGRLVKTVPAEEYSTLKNGLGRGIYIVNGEKMMVE